MKILLFSMGSVLTFALASVALAGNNNVSTVTDVCVDWCACEDQCQAESVPCLEECDASYMKGAPNWPAWKECRAFCSDDEAACQANRSCSGTTSCEC